MSSKTKIVVLHMKEIIYTVLFICLGILLVALLTFMFHPKNKVTTVFSVAGPSVRFTDEIIEELLPVVKAMTEEISRSLSYR